MTERLHWRNLCGKSGGICACHYVNFSALYMEIGVLENARRRNRPTEGYTRFDDAGDCIPGLLDRFLVG